MNAIHTDSPARPAVTRTTPVVAVVAEHDILDDAVVALVDKLGFVAVIHDVDSRDRRLPGYAVVVVTRAPRRYAALAEMSRYRMATIVGIGLADGHGTVGPSVSTATGVSQLRSVLADATRHHPELELPRPDGHASTQTRVHVTQRELEVLRTYVFGETICATARAHTIGESTVREHYRRVRERYARAGLPVGNKAQLLLALVNDGWLSTDLSGETDQSARPADWRAGTEGVRNV